MNQWHIFGRGKEEDDIPLKRLAIHGELMNLLRKKIDLTNYTKDIDRITFSPYINIDTDDIEPLFDQFSNKRLEIVIPIDLHFAKSATDKKYFEFIKRGLVDGAESAIFRHGFDFDFERFKKDVLNLSYSEVDEISVENYL